MLKLLKTKMKITRKKQPLYKRPLFLVVALVVVVGAAITGYYIYRNAHKATTDNQNSQNQVNKVDYNPPTNDQKKAGDQTKKDYVDDGNSGTSTPQNATISISRVTQGSAGQPVSVRSVVNGTATGQCVFVFSMAGKPDVTNTVAISTSATTYVCNTDVPASSFSADGNWSLTAYVTYNSSRISNTVGWVGNPINIKR